MTGARHGKTDSGTDDPEEIADAFVLSGSGFLPKTVTDLGLPVVDPEEGSRPEHLRDRPRRGLRCRVR